MTITAICGAESFEFEPEETLAWARSISPESELAGHSVTVTYDLQGNFVHVGVDGCEPKSWVSMLDIAELVDDLCPPLRHPALGVSP